MMEPAAPGGGGGVDPRVDFIASRIQMMQTLQAQQMEQMQRQMADGHGPAMTAGGHGHSHGGTGGHGHSHDGEPCDGHGHDPARMSSIMQRMQTFLQKQQGDEASASPENVAKVQQVMEMVKKMQAGGMMGGMGGGPMMGGPMMGAPMMGAPMMGGAMPMGMPPSSENNQNLSTTDQLDDDDKINLMAGDVASDAPHRNKNWMAYSAGGGTGPQDSMLQGGGHFSPPVFGWGELVKQDHEMEKANNARNAAVAKKNEKAHTSFMMPHETDTSGGVIHKTLPIVGRVRFLTDIQGLCFWSIVVLYWIMGNYSTWNVILLPQYYDGNLSIKWLIGYGIISILCIMSHLRASTLNPGKIPYFVSQNSVDHPDWSYCAQCDQKRPPRAHHCRRCKQCVMKMDHHCPWINNCVGEENQWAFVLLITYAQLLSLSSLAANLLWYYRMPPCQSCDPTTFAIFHSRALVNIVTVLAVMMIFFSLGLLCSQHMSVVLDFTTLEWMQLERTASSTGKMPDQGELPSVKKSLFRSYSSLCGDTLFLWWPLPCRRRRAPTLKRMEDV